MRTECGWGVGSEEYTHYISCNICLLFFLRGFFDLVPGWGRGIDIATDILRALFLTCIYTLLLTVGPGRVLWERSWNIAGDARMDTHKNERFGIDETVHNP